MESPALGQTDEPPPEEGEEGGGQEASQQPRTYGSEFFSRFAPRTAIDMLRQVPGFVIREAAQERGLGQATGNVLLNGQRLAGKSEDIQTQLGRIPAGNVIRIEILNGATLDIPGLSGPVANVVVRAGRWTGQYSWHPELRPRFADPLLSRFTSSLSGREGPAELTLGLENRSERSAAGGPTIISSPSGDLLERRDDVWTNSFEDPWITARMVLDGPGSSVGNVNGSYRRFRNDYDENGRRSGPGRLDRDRQVSIDDRGDGHELGGDFEFALGPGRLKLIGLDRGGRTKTDFAVVTRFSDGSLDSGDRLMIDNRTSERIARAEYRWNSGGADWQVSAESAFNSTDAASRLFLLERSGDFREIPFPGGTSRVEETRYDLGASHGRALAPDLRVQLALGAENSRLTQTGPGGLDRTFWRPKGLLSAAWQARRGTAVNFQLQRRVGQLNFFDFLAQVNLSEDRANAGNPDLVPPQSWEAQLEVEQDLRAWGNATLRLYGHLIEDIVDIVPIGAAGESPGNIDKALRYGADLRATVNFDPLGWRGAKLDARYNFERSRLEDPLTGEARSISNNLLHLVSLGLRHDIPQSDWAWGGSLFYQLNALTYRLTEVGRRWDGPVRASLFVEHKDVLGLTVRATVDNLLGADSLLDRTVFAGRRTDPVAFVERRDRTIGPIYTLQVSGRF